MSQDNTAVPPPDAGVPWMTPARARTLAAAVEDLARQVQEARPRVSWTVTSRAVGPASA